ncbi:MAG: hypothetical protein IPL50_11735 [Chitinophagaceae bacterium]|nr:hypothetical protein [Chitinophagaceae bacterium]
MLVYIVGTIKSYIMIILVLSISTFLFFNFISFFKNVVIKAFVLLLFIFIITIIAFQANFAGQLKILAEESKVQIDSFQKIIRLQNRKAKALYPQQKLMQVLKEMILHSP